MFGDPDLLQLTKQNKARMEVQDTAGWRERGSAGGHPLTRGLTVGTELGSHGTPRGDCASKLLL